MVRRTVQRLGVVCSHFVLKQGLFVRENGNERDANAGSMRSALKRLEDSYSETYQEWKDEALARLRREAHGPSRALKRQRSGEVYLNDG